MSLHRSYNRSNVSPLSLSLSFSFSRGEPIKENCLINDRTSDGQNRLETERQRRYNPPHYFYLPLSSGLDLKIKFDVSIEIQRTDKKNLFSFFKRTASVIRSWLISRWKSDKISGSTFFLSLSLSLWIFRTKFQRRRASFSNSFRCRISRLLIERHRNLFHPHFPSKVWRISYIYIYI